MHNEAGKSRPSRKGWLIVGLLGLAVTVGLVAILVFRVSPVAVGVGAMVLLHPLMHLGMGHSHGGGQSHKHGAEGQGQGQKKTEGDDHRHCS